MVPYDTYRIYQIDRDKSLAEVRRADEQAACPAWPNWLARLAAKPAPQRDAAGGLT